jgi:hypothetical protein
VLPTTYCPNDTVGIIKMRHKSKENIVAGLFIRFPSLIYIINVKDNFNRIGALIQAKM